MRLISLFSKTRAATWAAALVAAALVTTSMSWSVTAQEKDPEKAVARCVEMAQTAPQGNSGQPVPRFVSLKYPKVNVRRGPDYSYAVDWQYLRQGLPVMVVAEHKDWRKICDVEGETGWIHLSQLSGSRRVLVLVDGVSMRMRGLATSRPVAVVRKYAVLELRRCSGQWCLLRYDSLTGWMPRSYIWGTMAQTAK